MVIILIKSHLCTFIKIYNHLQGCTVIHLAAKFDQLEIIEWILQIEGVKAAKQQTFNGATCESRLLLF